MKKQHFHTKLPCQKLLLRQIEYGVHNGTITKNLLLPRTTSFFDTSISAKESAINSSLNIPIAQIVVLFLTASVLFEGVFSQ